MQKKFFYWMSAVILVCSASVFTACTSDTSDNPVPVQPKNSITVKEGAEVTPKVTVSPTSATEGQTVTLTAVNGYKFRRVEVANASVTTEDNGQMMINKTLMTVPITWIQEQDTYLTADELPGFKPITAEEAAQWVPTESDKEEGAYLIYGFDAEGNMLYYATILGQDPISGEPGRMPHNNMSSISNGSALHVRFYYTSSATVIGDKTEATFQMPAGAANVDVDMVRDMNVDVTATMKATEFSLKKEGDAYVLTEGEGLAAILPDVYDEISAPLVEMQESIDYTLQLQKQGESADKWDDVKTLSEGTFRWLLIGIDTYEGTMTSAPFTLALEPDLNLAENIIGKWMVAELDGQPCPTNLKTVVTFESSTKAYGSISDILSESWSDYIVADVTINGNKMTITSKEDEHTSHALEVEVFSMTDNDMLLSSKWTIYTDGEATYSETYGEERWTRVTSNYQDDIVGLWEGKATRDLGDASNDELHRWECKADDTYVFYSQADGEWKADPCFLADYFVDGILLCTRWQDTADSEELREWWEIESIENGVMKGTALRMREDGTTYTATFEMTKVQ